MPLNDETKKITEALYEHNLELAVKNKTLSLLRKLYQVSLLILDPITLSQKISEAIRTDLNFDLVGILILDKKSDSLVPLNFSKSDRLDESLREAGFLFSDIKITGISSRPIFKKSVYNKTFNLITTAEKAWDGLVDPKILSKIKEDSNLKNILLNPLISENSMTGLLLMGMNRDYETLNAHEKDSINSLRDVVAVALEKAYLYKELQDANESLRNLIKQRESLVHLVTHKVKGSFTRTKYIFAEMLEGTFGVLSPMLKKMADEGLESDNQGIETVDLVLNAANLQTGTVKYEMKPVDFRKIVDQIIKVKKDPAESKGLKFEVDIKDGDYNILGDAFWLKEVVHNLVDNSVKYTLKGGLKVGLKKEDGKILFYVKDTGVGITDEDKRNLFKEGGRGRNSVKVNVDSTGYGLFTVKLIVDVHKGRIWAESEGENKGSTFFVELDAI
ncbi:GAF domain-containing sensor histidine kinase [Patescibacteria group bacterium]|nr:GAF domain-containing sensor histidine kinase [Patescibacteria group bacterium]MBU1727985.1 GAF domain-containing sensor histidine kinase [Patescibacteria group bacterium]